MADKNFIGGNGKEINFENGGSIINLNLKFADLEKLPKEKGYIKLTIGKRKEKDEYGNTHYIYENNYKKESTTVNTGPEEDLPF